MSAATTEGVLVRTEHIEHADKADFADEGARVETRPVKRDVWKFPAKADEPEVEFSLVICAEVWVKP